MTLAKDLATLAWQLLLVLGAIVLFILAATFAVLRYLVAGILIYLVIHAVIGIIRGAFRS